MLDAAPVQHGFQSVPVAAGRPSTRTPPSPPACARRTNTGLCFGCLSAASLATFSWRFNLPVASVRLSRSRAKRRLGNRRRDRAQSVVLPAPAGTVRPCSAAGGLFEAERRHRRWSRSRSVLPPAAPSTLRTKARSYSRSYQRLAGTLHLASRCEATDPVHHGPAGITGAAGRLALLAAFTTARCARLRSRSALRRCSRLRSGCASRCRRFLSR